MPTFTMTKNWSNNNVLTEAQLDDIKTSTETFINTTKLDGDNLQASGIVANNLASNAVTTAKINANAVTRAKLEAVGQQISTLDSGTFSHNTSTPIDVTNLSVLITTTGRPVVLFLQSGGSLASIEVNGATGQGTLLFKRDSTTIANYLLNSTSASQIFAATFVHLDIPAAGTYTYKVQASAPTGTIFVNEYKLVAFEL